MIKSFPAPVPLSQQVKQQRKERQKQLIGSCLRGVSIRLLIILAELVGVFLYNSASLLMDAIASSVDILSSVVLILCIKLAARPPDEDHPFGHGRYEPLFGLQLGILMFVMGGWMIVQQLWMIADIPPTHPPLNTYSWLIPLIAVILLEICYQVVMRTAKRQNSPALAADAVHYRVDGATSLCAAIALGIAAYFPDWGLLADHIGAVVIAVMMVGIGFYAARQNIRQILDHVPDKKYFDIVRQAAKRVEGVKETEKIRIQLYGPDAHIDIDVEVDPSMSVDKAHLISQHVRAQIQQELPMVRDVIVHIEPFYPNDH